MRPAVCYSEAHKSPTSPRPGVAHHKKPTDELLRLENACQGRAFAQRRDAAVVAVFKATGIRLSELAGICYDAEDARRSDLDLWNREITIRGEGGKACEVPKQSIVG